MHTPPLRVLLNSCHLKLSRRCCRGCCYILLVLLFPAIHAKAHEFTITPVTFVILGNGDYQVDIGLDIDALALGLPLDTDSTRVSQLMQGLSAGELEEAIESARQSIRNEIQILCDGADSAFEVSFPHQGTPAAISADPPTMLGTLARLRGEFPGNAQTGVFRAHSRYKTVSLEIITPTDRNSLTLLIEPDQASSSFPLTGSLSRSPQSDVWWSYIKLGFEHIVPKGLDHILFVLGLFLLSTTWRILLYQISAFTVAHTVTLMLSMQGFISLPGQLVETLIALSISWVAIENIATSTLKPWRLVLVFGFGLLHGLGFSSVLSGLGMPQDRFLAALLAFNLGVEIGQLSVVALAFMLVGRFHHLLNYRKMVVIPCSAVIGVIGLWWGIERALL